MLHPNGKPSPRVTLLGLCVCTCLSVIVLATAYLVCAINLYVKNISFEIFKPFVETAQL